MIPWRSVVPIVAGLVIAVGAGATDVKVSGLFPTKAVVQIDGGPLQTLSIGQKTAEGVTLVAVDRDAATFDIEGQRLTIALGHARMATSATAVESAVLTSDLQGHFRTDGQINGRSVRFVVDTGATLVALPSDDARRIAIDYRKGQLTMMRTANGIIPGYLVKLDTVNVGNVTLHGIDAVVIEGNGLSTPLLGMSFLNRMNMTREGSIMTLTRRY